VLSVPGSGINLAYFHGNPPADDTASGLFLRWKVLALPGLGGMLAGVPGRVGDNLGTP
jgi:hypothetical protein